MLRLLIADCPFHIARYKNSLNFSSDNSHYMPSTTAEKLKIKEGYSLLTIHAPVDFEKDVVGLPADIKISEKAKAYNQIHWFVKDKAQLEKEVDKVVGLLKD